MFHTFGHCRWFLWLWQRLYPWVRNQHCSTEHCPLRWRSLMRIVLRAQVCWFRRMHTRQPLHNSHCYQLLPSQPAHTNQQRRLVQHAQTTFRHGPAGISTHCQVPCRHCASHVQKVVMEADLLRLNNISSHYKLSYEDRGDYLIS